jgi:hypothetical protein
MSAVQAIKAAHTAGIELSVAGNKLVVDAVSEPPPSVIENLRRYKLEIVELLRFGGQLPEIPQIPESGPEPRGGGRKAAIKGEACRDQYEERAAILEFDDWLPRAEAEAIARRQTESPYTIEQASQIAHRDAGAGSDDQSPEVMLTSGLYTAAVAALRSQCPELVGSHRWRQAVEDATAFLSSWGTQAQAFGWTVHELFGLHPTAQLSRYNAMGLVWLLQGRPVIALTAAEAVFRAASGATLTYRRYKPAREPLGNNISAPEGAR